MHSRKITCGDYLDPCICDLPFQHYGRHECGCGAAWVGEFRIPTAPLLVIEKVDEPQPVDQYETFIKGHWGLHMTEVELDER